MESFEELAVQYEPMIRKMIWTLNIYKNYDEFFQTGLISLWEATLVYDETKGNFPSIAYKYIRGRMLQELTQTNKHDTEMVYPKEEFWETVEDDHGAGVCEQEILLSYCSGSNLTDNQTKWVLHTFLSDRSIVEIATLENVSSSTVKQWRKGAKAKLSKNSRKLS